VIKLISNVGGVTSIRELFNTLSSLPVPCIYNTEIVYDIKFNIKVEWNKTHIDMIIIQSKDQILNQNFIELSLKNNIMGINTYNNLPSHLKNLKYSTPSKETKTILIAAHPPYCRETCLKISMQNVIVYNVRTCFKKCNPCKSINC
jgi:hypothetical protein